MIGGIDLRIPTRAGLDSIEVAVRALRLFWRGAVFENATNGEPYHQFDEIPFGVIVELFVYRDAESQHSWDEAGATPENCNSMIHFLYDEGLLTVVVDEIDHLTEELIQTIRTALSDTILSVAAQIPEAA